MTIRKLSPLLIRGMVAAAFLLSVHSSRAWSEDAPSNPQIDRYRQALAVDPDNLPLHYYLGVALLFSNDNQQAVDEFRRAYPAFSDSIEMNYNLGLAYARLGDADSALLYFEEAEALGALAAPELYPLANAYYNLGLAFLEGDALDDAARLFHRVLSLDPSRVEIHRLLGDLYARQGETEKALEALTAYLDQNPKDSAAREYVYTLYFNEALKFLDKDRPRSRTLFEKALESSPGSPLALYYLGYLDYLENEPGKAARRLIPIYEKSPPELQKNIRSILFNCALALREQSLPQEAMDAIAALTAKEESDPKALFLAGNVALDLGDFVRARTYYEQVLSLDPSHRGAALNLVTADAGALAQRVAKGRDLFRKGDYPAALRELEGALGINPDDATALAYAKEARQEVHKMAASHFARARAAETEGHWQTALEEARAGLALAPEDPSGLALEENAVTALAAELERALSEGRELLALGELEQATKSFDRALALDPNRAEARQGKADIEGRLREMARAASDRGQRFLDEGKLPEARAAFAEALALQPGLPEAETGLARCEVLVHTVVNDELQWGRRAMHDDQFAEAREHFANALRLKDAPEIRRELEAVDNAFSAKVDSLLRAAGEKASRNDFEGARKLYGVALALAPNHGAATRGMKALRGQRGAFVKNELEAAGNDLGAGNLQKALEHYRRALDAEPANGEALEGLRRGKELLGGDLAALIRAGKTALDAGHFAEAEASLHQALALDPYSGEARKALDRLEATRPPKGAPTDPQKLYLEGIELYTLGRYQEAVAIWEQVLILSPDHEKAHLNIEKARRKLRQIREYQGG